MPSPYTPLKITTGAAFALSLLAMYIGLMLSRTALFGIGVVMAVLGCVYGIRTFGRFLRILTAEQDLLRDGADQLDPGTRRRSLAQQVFLLLFTVAEVDGRAGPGERDLVRRFLLERFLDPRVYAELATWDAEPIPPRQLGALVHELRLQLTRAERETLFYWCCLVALIDQRFNQDEHELLQTVAHHLGLAPDHARVIFLHAKHRILSSRGSYTGDQRRAGWPPPRRPEPAPNRRERALSILGLEQNATPDQIRRRHRELVKKHHPDAHTHLGPVAAQEATERFREIQEAYEVLNGGR